MLRNNQRNKCLKTILGIGTHTLQVQRRSCSVTFHLTTGTHGTFGYVLRNQGFPQFLTQLIASGRHFLKAIQST